MISTSKSSEGLVLGLTISFVKNLKTFDQIFECDEDFDSVEDVEFFYD